MSREELPKILGFTIIQTGKILLKNVNVSFANFTSEITFDQMTVLYHISSKNGRQIIQQDLAELMGKNKSVMVKTIDILEQKGFVKRITVANDKRKNSIQLTKKANHIVIKMHLAFVKMDGILEHGISKKDLLGCLSVLLKIQEKCI